MQHLLQRDLIGLMSLGLYISKTVQFVLPSPKHSVHDIIVEREMLAHFLSVVVKQDSWFGAN